MNHIDKAGDIARTTSSPSKQPASDTRVLIARFMIGATMAIALAANLAGCAGGMNAVAAPPWWEPHLTLDRDLRVLGLRNVRLTRSHNERGFLRIAGEYVNQSDAKLSAIFRFTWLDASGMPVESILGEWQAVHALPRTRATFAGIAPRGDVRDFRVELMAAHRLKGQAARTNSGR